MNDRKGLPNWKAICKAEVPGWDAFSEQVQELFWPELTREQQEQCLQATRSRLRRCRAIVNDRRSDNQISTRQLWVLEEALQLMQCMFRFDPDASEFSGWSWEDAHE